MAQCVVINGTGQLEAVTAEPCVGLVVLTPAEYAAMASNPFVLTAEEGAAVSVAILGAWATAWGMRALYRVLYIDGEIHSE